MKRVIVTGANGFVGSNIVSALTQDAWLVSALDREFDNPAVATWNHDRVERVRTSCADMPSIPADALVHAAFVTARPEERGESPEDNLRANIEPLLQVMEYAKAEGIYRSVFISSSAVFRHTPATPVDEMRPPNPLGVYGVAKTMMEHTVDSMRHLHGCDMVCARLGGVYGSYEYSRSTRPKLSMVAQMMQDALSKGEIVVSTPAEVRQWTLAADIGRAIAALLGADSLNHSLYNLASGERKSDLAIARMIQGLVEGLRLHLPSANEAPARSSAKLGWLDNSRLRRDTGYDDWTAMSQDTLATVLASLAVQVSDA
ncbi:MAG: NAD(P)-dependent oxidoreductase [Chloroflexi bacterium]|nr:NAD(P)-dependent oxidoreductase [Chloroflexota bacterium]